MSLKARDKHIFSQDKNVAKLTEETPEQAAYKQQSKILRDIVPSDDSTILSGVLYYRVKGQLNQARLEELHEMELKKMTTLHRRIPRRFSNTFSQKLEQRRQSLAASNGGLASENVSSMHATQDEDANLVTAEFIKALPDVQELHLQRLSRAVDSRASELESLYASSAKSSAQQQEILGHQGTRSSFISAALESLVPEDIRHSLSYRSLPLDRPKQMAETQKRLAQDRLLFNQLEAGILPETFIKPGGDPRSIMINLSRYGIGDARGLCLGKWYVTLLVCISK